MNVPIKPLMHWSKSKRQWYRMLRGQQRWFTPSANGLPATMEGSIRHANAYWLEQEAIIREQTRPKPVALPLAMDEVNAMGRQALVRTPAWLRANGQKKDYIDAWLAEQERDYLSGKIAKKTFAGYKTNGNAFKEWLACNPLVAVKVNENLVNEYAKFLHEAKQSKDWKRLRWQHAACYIKWLHANRHINELPRNLDTRRKWQGTVKSYVCWTPEEFRQCYAATSDLGRLVMLLAANAGMYPSDMKRINWQGEATIKDWREKTGSKGKEAEFHLWPETMEYLGKVGASLGSNFSKMTAKFPKPLKNLRHTSADLLGRHDDYAIRVPYFLRNGAKTIDQKHYVRPFNPPEMFAWLHDQYFGQ